VRVTAFRILQSHSPTGYYCYPVDPARPDMVPWCVSALSAAHVGAGHFNEGPTFVVAYKLKLRADHSRLHQRVTQQPILRLSVDE
jgi:hypothetical protein